MKVNLLPKIMQSTYLCVIFHVNHQKLTLLAVLTWFLILGKVPKQVAAKMVTIVANITDL